MIIPGFSSYDIDEHGNITNTRTGTKIKNNTTCRYVTARLTRDDGTRCTETVHTLMAASFGLKSDYQYVVAFKDGNTHNVELSNIECISRSELSRRNYNVNQKRRTNKCNTPEARGLIVDALGVLEVPTTMSYLSGYLNLPYAVVRYSLKQLIEDGIVLKMSRGYVLK